MNMRQRIKTKLKLLGEEQDSELRIDENIEEKPLFHLFFLKDDKDLSVEVLEVQEVDFIEVRKRLEIGESVFISRKSEKRLDQMEIHSEEMDETWFFPHV
jgi:hypothetical protein